MDVIKVLIFIGAISLWLYSKMKKRENKQRSDRPISNDRDVIRQTEDIFSQWDEEIPEEEPAEVEIQPAMSSIEEMVESKSHSITELAQEEKSEKKEKPKEKKPTVVTIAGMPLSSKNIRHGIIFSEILKRRGQNV